MYMLYMCFFKILLKEITSLFKYLISQTPQTKLKMLHTDRFSLRQSTEALQIALCMLGLDNNKKNEDKKMTYIPFKM